MKTGSLIFSFICLATLSCSSGKKIIAVTENWYDLLPHCPCRNPDFKDIQTADGWAREARNDEMKGLKKLIMGKRDFRKWHPGSSACFRSYPPVRTIINGENKKSGQQCAYDEKGNLIKTGPAAGTPDKVSPARGESEKGVLKVRIFGLLGHRINDSGPWNDADWQTYHKYWPPDKGINCE